MWSSNNPRLMQYQPKSPYITLPLKNPQLGISAPLPFFDSFEFLNLMLLWKGKCNLSYPRWCFSLACRIPVTMDFGP